MGNTYGIGEMDRFKVCGISGPLPSIFDSGTHKLESLEQPSSNEGVSNLDQNELENSSNCPSNCNVLDSVRTAEALRNASTSNKSKRVRRFCIATLVAWSIASTLLNTITWPAIKQFDTLMTQQSNSILQLEEEIRRLKEHSSTQL